MLSNEQINSTLTKVFGSKNTPLSLVSQIPVFVVSDKEIPTNRVVLSNTSLKRLHSVYGSKAHEFAGRFYRFLKGVGGDLAEVYDVNGNPLIPGAVPVEKFLHYYFERALSEYDIEKINRQLHNYKKTGGKELLNRTHYVTALGLYCSIQTYLLGFLYQRPQKREFVKLAITAYFLIRIL